MFSSVSTFSISSNSRNPFFTDTSVDLFLADSDTLALADCNPLLLSNFALPNSPVSHPSVSLPPSISPQSVILSNGLSITH